MFNKDIEEFSFKISKSHKFSHVNDQNTSSHHRIFLQKFDDQLSHHHSFALNSNKSYKLFFSQKRLGKFLNFLKRNLGILKNFIS